MKPQSILFLHGFLGKPQDWASIQNHLRKRFAENMQMETVSLWEILKENQDFSLSHVAQLVTPHVEGKTMVVGYSLGGRILMHLPAMLRFTLPALVFIASHWALEEEIDKKNRILLDEAWAEKFKHQSWETLMQEWNAQSVFGQDTFRPERSEKDFDRTLLAQTIAGCSVGRQQFIEQPWARSHWIYGSEDHKLVSRIPQLKNKYPEVNTYVIEGGGHSLLWAQKPELSQILSNIFCQVGGA
ncbi:MAG: hypothetical protein H6623_04205 [Bdellovibrionaceae bacterium]|nr:hypothetical protein [Pseudobdellovibrionaceae bacterium]